MIRDPEVTHKIMSAIASKNTKPEMLLRKALWAKGLRYRTNVKNLPGKPDIVFAKYKLAIFCDGDFWHGHNWALRGFKNQKKELDSYAPFWRNKIKNNIARDKKNNADLKKLGWSIIRFWESEIKQNTSKCVIKISHHINKHILKK